MIGPTRFQWPKAPRRPVPALGVHRRWGCGAVALCLTVLACSTAACDDTGAVTSAFEGIMTASKGVIHDPVDYRSEIQDWAVSVPQVSADQFKQDEAAGESVIQSVVETTTESKPLVCAVIEFHNRNGRWPENDQDDEDVIGGMVAPSPPEELEDVTDVVAALQSSRSNPGQISNFFLGTACFADRLIIQAGG
jgi:major membrane immunogen (membrane-anchored lipoprotein)